MTDKHGMPQYDGMEYEELVAAVQFLWMENAKMRNLLQQNYEFMVHLNETEAYPSSGDLDMQMWLLLNEAGIEVTDK